jgi:hypothetical protein
MCATGGDPSVLHRQLSRAETYLRFSETQEAPNHLVIIIADHRRRSAQRWILSL